MTAHLYTFEKLLSASSQEQIFNFLGQQCEQLGYNCFFYSPVIGGPGGEKLFKEDRKILQGEELIKQNAFTTYPASWIHRYQEAGHVRKDPVVRLIATSNLPVFWDDITRSHKKHVVFDEARQHGLANGITVPVYGQSGERALLSIATEIAPEKSPDHRIATAGMAVLIALHLHEAVQRINRKDNEPSIPRLTHREKECLQWAAKGKTSWEIGNILSLSERTVIFHMVNATKKLNATNRRQAVVRALSLRLIAP